MKTGRVPILKNKDVLIVPVSGDLDDLELTQFELTLLSRVKREEVRGIVLDVSSVDTIDLFMARKLIALTQMVGLMDVVAVLAGIRPAVAVTLTDMGVRFNNLQIAPTLEHAIELLEKLKG